jgi:hypothetical protein
MHLKISSAGKCAYLRKGTTSRVIVASRNKVNFWPDGITSPGNYGSLFVLIHLSKQLTSSMEHNSRQTLSPFFGTWRNLTQSKETTYLNKYCVWLIINYWLVHVPCPHANIGHIKLDREY